MLYGSYTAQFGEEWPDLGYREHNGYPRTRLAQEEVAILEGWARNQVPDQLVRAHVSGTQSDCARMLGQDPAKVQAVPVEAILPAYQQIDEQCAADGVEHGVHMADTARFQGRRAVTDPTVTMDVLGMEPDDVVAAIEECFQWCLDNPPVR